MKAEAIKRAEDSHEKELELSRADLKRAVRTVIPYLDFWHDRESPNRVIQVLCGHSCFGEYLHRISCGIPRMSRVRSFPRLRTAYPRGLLKCRNAVERIIGFDLYPAAIARALETLMTRGMRLSYSVRK